jgi:hypothetical protein
VAEASVFVTVRLYTLLCEFALDLRGDPDGLTVAEMRRAWVARYRCQLPRHAISQLSELGMVRRYHRRRTCVVTGHYRAPWLPALLEGLPS